MGYITDDATAVSYKLESLYVKRANALNFINLWSWNPVHIFHHDAVADYNSCTFQIVQSFNSLVDAYITFNNAHPASGMSLNVPVPPNVDYKTTKFPDGLWQSGISMLGVRNPSSAKSDVNYNAQSPPLIRTDVHLITYDLTTTEGNAAYNEARARELGDATEAAGIMMAPIVDTCTVC
jgi:hypothetical protein